MTYRPDVQILRGIAVLVVVLFHLEISPFGSGFLGVDVFFVISGFIMWVTTAASPAPGAFALKRVMRIVPLYWLLTLFVAGPNQRTLARRGSHSSRD